MTKNIGKPYSGKLNVRFDEGEPGPLNALAPSRCGHQKVQKRYQPGPSSLLYRNTRLVFDYLRMTDNACPAHP
jgi:hypothetical protein